MTDEKRYTAAKIHLFVSFLLLCVTWIGVGGGGGKGGGGIELDGCCGGMDWS